MLTPASAGCRAVGRARAWCAPFAPHGRRGRRRRWAGWYDVLAAIRVLRDEGPSLGRPLVDRVKGSRHANMKELRPGSTGRTEIRVLFAFDKERTAILLAGGDKSEDWKGWDTENIQRRRLLGGQSASACGDAVRDRHETRPADRASGAPVAWTRPFEEAPSPGRRCELSSFARLTVRHDFSVLPSQVAGPVACAKGKGTRTASVAWGVTDCRVEQAPASALGR